MIRITRHWLAISKQAGRRTLGWMVRVELLSWPSLIIALVASYVTIVNVGIGTTVHFIDNLWPQDPGGYIVVLQYSWLPLRMGLYNFLSLIALPYSTWAAVLRSIGFDSSAQELFTVGPLEFMSGYFGFRIVRRHILQFVSNRLSTGLSLAAALAFMNNFYVQSVFWWDFIPEGFVMMAFGLAFLYYSLETFDNYLILGHFRISALVGMILSSTIAFSVSIPFNLSILALSVLLPPVVFLNHLSSRPKKRRLVVFSSINLLVVLLTSLWWLVPSYMMIQLQPTYIGNGLTEGQSLATFVTTTQSQTFLILLSGIVGYPYSQLGHTGATTFIYQNVGMGLSLGVLSIIGFALLVRSKRSSPVLPYLTSAASLLVLVMAGVNSPLYPTVFNLAFRNSIVLTALRTPFVAFGYGFMILWISCFILGVNEIGRWMKSHSTSLAGIPADRKSSWGHRSNAFWIKGSNTTTVETLLAMVVVVLPIFAAAPAAYLGDAVPTSPYQSHLKIPGFDYGVASYLEHNLYNQYALLYPSGFLDQRGPDGYQGFDVLPSLLPNSLLIDNFRQGFVAADNPLLDQAYQALLDQNTAGDGFAGLLAQLAVRYVVIEGNLTDTPLFGQAIAPNYPALLQELNGTNGIALSATIGPDYIYAVNDSSSIVSQADSSINAAALASGSILEQVNLTRSFYNSTLVNLPSAPFHSFAPQYLNGAFKFDVGPSERSNLSETRFPAPIGPSTPPTIFNGFPFGINTSIFPDLILKFSTNQQTAISISVLTTPNLTSAQTSTIESNSFNVVAPYDNLGLGDATLAPSYGFNHFTSPDKSTTLVTNLAGILGSSANRTVDYILIDMLPVEGGLGVPQGTPLEAWPGTQELEIYDIGIGSDVFSPPSFSPQLTSVAIAPVYHALNITSDYATGLFGASNNTPIRHLFPVLASPITLVTNRSEKTNWSAYATGPPFPSGGPPTYINAYPIHSSIGQLPFIRIGLSTSNDTAYDAAVASITNLSNLTLTQLDADLHFLGGDASNLGPGDPLLFAAYGGLHYHTGTTIERLEDNLPESFGTMPGTNLTYLVFQMYYVNNSGYGVRNLPVSEWPGNQILSIYDISLSNYGLTSGSNFPDGSVVGLETPVDAKPLRLLNSSEVVTDRGPNGPFNHGFLRVNITSPTEIFVSVQKVSPNQSPFLFVLHETYAPGWILIPEGGIHNWSSTIVDSTMFGFFVYPESDHQTISFQLFFAPQSEFEFALYGGLGIPLVVSAGLIAAARWKDRDSIDS